MTSSDELTASFSNYLIFRAGKEEKKGEKKRACKKHESVLSERLKERIIGGRGIHRRDTAHAAPVVSPRVSAVEYLSAARRLINRELLAPRVFAFYNASATFKVPLRLNHGRTSGRSASDTLSSVLESEIYPPARRPTLFPPPSPVVRGVAAPGHLMKISIIKPRRSSFPLQRRDAAPHGNPIKAA